MQTIWQQLDTAFRRAIQAAFDLQADPLVSPAQNEKFGDYQSNAAMGLSKALAARSGQKTNPRQVAEKILEHLELGAMTDSPPSPAWIAGPGFINVRLSPNWLSTQLTSANRDERLGVDPVAKPQTVVIDYSGPNIAKELHVGHLRSTIIGDAMARLLGFHGDQVIRQNHLGDWGTQFGMLIAFLRSEGAQAADVADLDRFYKAARAKFDADPAFAEVARQTVVCLQAGEAEERALWGKIVEATRRHFQPLYARLNVLLTAADERGESFYNPLLPAVVQDLKAAGIAQESEGAMVVFTEGEEAPLIIQKQDRGYGYGTTDLAAIRYRVSELHADRVLYFVGTPQSQHFRQVFAAAARAGWSNGVSLEHANFGSVLGEDRKMFRARKGESVKLADLLEEAVQRAFALVSEKRPELPEAQRREIADAVGVGAVKYADLSKDRVSDYVFSFDSMLSMDGNSAPYMQFAYARVKSIFRRAAERGIAYDASRGASIDLKEHQELALGKQILQFGEVIESVARELKPHLLCAYLYDLAGKYSSFYEACPVLTSEEPVRSSRLALVDLTAKILARGLELLGIGHPEQL